MIGQQDLDWGTEPRSRTSDPGTSHTAAASMQQGASAHHQLILEILGRLGDATPEEIAADSGGQLDKVQVCKRVKEMERLNLIVAVVEDEQPKTRRNASGRRARVWEAV